MKRLFVVFIALAMFVVPAYSQKKDTYRVRTVVIDPGHGGAKPGAQGSRSWEKDITLSVATKFGKLIADNYPDVKVIFTRTTDADISLAERARIANRAKADLFISIHANSHPTSSPTGVETFVMGLSESKANLEVAQKENADILLEADYKQDSYYQGFDPSSPESYVVLTMFQNEYITKSLNLAQAIQNQYKQSLRTINRGVKQAELFVLYKTAMPSVLTEIGFISNPAEEAFMLSDEGQAQIAICLFNAFMAYKASEEGTSRIANPIINIPGYAQAEEKAAAEEVRTQEKANTKPIEVAEEPKAAMVADTVKAVIEQAEKVVETAPKIDTVKVVSKLDTIAFARPAKPVPSASLVEREERPKEPEAAPVVAPATPQPKESLRAPTNTAADGATSYYTVQFLTVNTLHKAGAAELEGISDFTTFRQGNAYAYITGRFRTMKEANDYAAHIRRTTSFRDAWAYLYKGAPAQQQTASTQQATTSKPTSTAATEQQGVVYRVQFCTATRIMKQGDPDLCGISDFRYAQSGRYYLYTAGNYTSRAEAEKRCATIRRTTPFRDAFVVGFKNGQRINLE